MILLDTCVISESLKPEPDALVMGWLDGLVEQDVFLPAMVVGELRKGVESLPAGQRRVALGLWLDQLEDRFDGRILPFDRPVAHQWGCLMARLASIGRPMPAHDAQIAAYALQQGAVLATRNTADFEASGCRLMNPWLPI